MSLFSNMIIWKTCPECGEKTDFTADVLMVALSKKYTKLECSHCGHIWKEEN